MIRVVIVDDEEIVRAGVRTLLEAAEDIVVVAEAASGARALAAVARHAPDVVVLDLLMPEGPDGAETAGRLRADAPDLGILVLTTRVDEAALARVWRSGADGYLLKTASGEEMRRAVRDASRHRAVLSPDLLAPVLDTYARHRHAANAEFLAGVAGLSVRELRVLLALADGAGNQEIAGALDVAEGTVKTYVSRTLRKLGLDNRTRLALLANDHRRLLRETLERRERST
ncbi:response regulator (plasmid) [Streptomyces sp. BI20]|uniref:response regulator n=1 Tax=Streptomyces sp. BI20 TaxID=3403460 RepID=UPI003C75494D